MHCIERQEGEEQDGEGEPAESQRSLQTLGVERSVRTLGPLLVEKHWIPRALHQAGSHRVERQSTEGVKGRIGETVEPGSKTRDPHILACRATGPSSEDGPALQSPSDRVPVGFNDGFLKPSRRLNRHHLLVAYISLCELSNVASMRMELRE